MRKNIFHSFYLLIFTAILMSAGIVQAQNRPYRVSDRQVQYLLNRIEQRTDIYKRALDRSLDRSKLDGSDSEDMIMDYITAFENSTDLLKQKFDAKESVGGDVEDVLTRATYINAFMERNRLDLATQRHWRNIRTDLNTLSRYYQVSWNWNNPVPTPTNRAYRVSDREVQTLLTRIETKSDTFKRMVNSSLDRSRLDDTKAEDAINNYITEFENATDKLKQNFDARKSVSSDVEQVLMQATAIDGFLNDYRMNYNVQQQWTSLKTDLNSLAGFYNVSWDWNRRNQSNPRNTTARLPYNVNDTQMQRLLTSIETKTDIYKRDMSYALDRSPLDDTRSERAVLNYITEFENATDKLKQNFDARKSTAQDVNEVLSRAYYIDSFMRDYRFDARAERNWKLLRGDLDTLSNYYSVSWNWDTRQYEPPTKFDTMLSGTYQLNANESDNVKEVVNRALNYYTASQRERLRTNLETRLQSPEMLAIEKTGTNVTVASSTSPQVTFAADGTRRTETTPTGRAIDVTARTYYDGVAISYEGDRVRDFYVNFMPMSNGKLKVIRRVYLEDRNDTITVASVYDKVSETAQWAKVTNSGSNRADTINDFYIPNGTRITAALNNKISTEASKNGDRFAMTITSPSQFNGAIIEGRVVKAEQSGRVSGRANITLDFDTIRLRNGQTYRFAGIIENVKTADGENVSVTNEGTVRDSNQTTKTVTRAGIGAALGALIGAIAGGGEGAAIGAAIGAGAGAGTIFIQGRDNIELEQGSEFTITSSAPASVGSR